MKRTVVSLVSGGLDSLLAARLMQLQGLEVCPVHFTSPWGCDEKAIANIEQQIGKPVVRIEKGAGFIGLVRNPVHGYGRNMNPCIDCRIFMFRRMAPLARELEAAAVVTGEVVGQRPMSQTRKQIHLIDRESGLGGMILRPLSAKLLSPTDAELRGVVDRASLYGFSGRARTPQIALAAQLGITRYDTPAGGCKLTTAGFTPKLRDFLGHYGDENTTDARLLNYGRHFRLSGEVKVVLGRDREENRILEGYVTQILGSLVPYTAYVPDDFTGPTALACGPVSDSVDEFAGRAILRYARPQSVSAEGHTIRVITADGERLVRASGPLSDEDAARLRIGPGESQAVFGARSADATSSA